jgi:hypothetical protein
MVLLRGAELFVVTTSITRASAENRPDNLAKWVAALERLTGRVLLGSAKVFDLGEKPFGQTSFISVVR